MVTLYRSEIIDLLERLGARSDDEALKAARNLHKAVTDAGFAWTDLLRPGLEFDREDVSAERDARLAANRDDEDRAEAVQPSSGTRSPADPGEDGKILECLLASKAVTSELRGELKELKRDLAEGEFTAMDGDYIRALADRLGVKVGR